MIRSLITWLAIVSGFGLASLWMADATQPAVGQMRNRGKGSDFYIVEPRFREFNTGGLQMAAESTAATFDQAKNLVAANDINGYVMRDGHRTEVWADKGLYQVDATIATLTENVRVVNDEGYTFRTAEAQYQHAIRTLTADGAFVAESQSMRLNGVGLYYNLESDTFRIERGVDAKIERFSF